MYCLCCHDSILGFRGCALNRQAGKEWMLSSSHGLKCTCKLSAKEVEKKIPVLSTFLPELGFQWSRCPSYSKPGMQSLVNLYDILMWAQLNACSICEFGLLVCVFSFLKLKSCRSNLIFFNLITSLPLFLFMHWNRNASTKVQLEFVHHQAYFSL